MAAWHLGRRGHDVTVWEAADSVGGWAQTLPWPGPGGEPGWLERGPQSLRVARGSALGRLLLELDISCLPSGPRGPRWLGKEGSRHPSPATVAGLLRAPGPSPVERLRMLAEPFVGWGQHPGDSLHSFFARRLGEGFARDWLPALVAGVLAAPPEHLGLEALPRLRRLEAAGGLFLGALRLGPERTVRPAGGSGALAAALAARLPVATHRAVRALEPLPGGRWRANADGTTAEADHLVLALPSSQAAPLLSALAPSPAAALAAIPRLDLRVWHSRHAMVGGWERGFGLLIHPPEGRGLLGAVSLAADDPRGVPGLLQIRTYVGGAYPVAPTLSEWGGVIRELRRWLPELGEAVQMQEEVCPGAFPLLEPGHSARVAQITLALPPSLHWLGTERFGPGVPDLAEGIENWGNQLFATDKPG